MKKNLNLHYTNRFLMMCGLALIVLHTVSCSLPGKPKENTIKTYMLRWDAPVLTGQEPSQQYCLTLLVNTPRSAPGFESSHMVYIETPYRLDYFATHAWVDSPARMMAPLIRRDLESSGLFEKVVSSPVRSINYNLRLEFELQYLQQDFTAGKNEEQVGVRVDLFDVSHHELIGSKVFSLSEPAKARTPYAGVVAANQMMPRLMMDVIRFLKASIPDRPGACSESRE